MRGREETGFTFIPTCNTQGKKTGLLSVHWRGHGHDCLHFRDEAQRSETSCYSGRNGEDLQDVLCYTHKAEVSSMEDWGLVIHSLSQGRRGWWMPSWNLSLLNPSITAHLGINRLTQLDIIWQLQVSQQQPDAWENPWKINFKNLQSIMYMCTPTEFYFLISSTH